jgi:predicted Zn-dependent peptidase
VLGHDETLARLSVAALIGFRAAHMAPERVLVSIAGAFDRAETLAAIEQRFASLPPRASIEPAKALPASGLAQEERRLEQTHLVLTWSAPAAGEESMYAARLLAEIYGGGMSSRLFQEVRETRGLVYAIDAFVDALEDCGRLGVYAGCSAKNAKTVALIAADLLEGLAKDGPTEGELARAKAIAGAQLLMGAEAPLARADARASQVFLRGRLIDFDEVRRKVEAVTAEEVATAARRALGGPACAAAIGPKAGLASAAAFHARFQA